jgi:hypothetical protein
MMTMMSQLPKPVHRKVLKKMPVHTPKHGDHPLGTFFLLGPVNSYKP